VRAIGPARSIQRQRRRAGVAGQDDFILTAAGIGENSSSACATQCGALARLNVKLDARANASGGPRISASEVASRSGLSKPTKNQSSHSTHRRSFCVSTPKISSLRKL